MSDQTSCQCDPPEEPSTGSSIGLLKFVSWGTLVLILLFSLFLSIFLANQARQELLEKQHDFAQLLASTLNNDINKRFYIPNFWISGKPDLSKQDQYKRLEEVVRFATEDSPARNIRLYDTSGVVIYARDKDLLGKEGLGGESIAEAMEKEKYSFEFIYRVNALGAFFSAAIAPESVVMRVRGPLRIKGVIPVAMVEGGLSNGEAIHESEQAPGQDVQAGQSGLASQPGQRTATGGTRENGAAGENKPRTAREQASRPPGGTQAPAVQPDEQPEDQAKSVQTYQPPQFPPSPEGGQPGPDGSMAQPAGRLIEVEGVIGSLEFTMDITPDYQKLIAFQRIIILANLINALVIFFILRMLIHRADRINTQRLSERDAFERERVQNEKLVSMGRMVAGIAHEIRNPLGIIRSSSELLVSRTKDKDPLTAKIMGAIHEEAVRLSKTVGDFLDYARPRALKLEPVDLSMLLDQAVTFLEQKSRQQGVEIERLYPAEVMVGADKDLLYRAVYNILVNAMEAMAEGPGPEEGLPPGVITVSVSQGGDGVRLTIRDTGPGIPEEIRDKLLDPFFTTKQTGTGLGLAITANILRGHGASLTLGSNPGGGARVDILFPRI